MSSPCLLHRWAQKASARNTLFGIGIAMGKSFFLVRKLQFPAKSKIEPTWKAWVYSAISLSNRNARYFSSITLKIKTSIHEIVQFWLRLLATRNCKGVVIFYGRRGGANRGAGAKNSVQAFIGGQNFSAQTFKGSCEARQISLYAIPLLLSMYLLWKVILGWCVIQTLLSYLNINLHVNVSRWKVRGGQNFSVQDPKGGAKQFLTIIWKVMTS